MCLWWWLNVEGDLTPAARAGGCGIEDLQQHRCGAGGARQLTVELQRQLGRLGGLQAERRFGAVGSQAVLRGGQQRGIGIVQEAAHIDYAIGQAVALPELLAGGLHGDEALRLLAQCCQLGRQGGHGLGGFGHPQGGLPPESGITGQGEGVCKDHGDGAVAEGLPEADRIGAAPGGAEGKHALLQGFGIAAGFCGQGSVAGGIGALAMHLLAVHLLLEMLFAAGFEQGIGPGRQGQNPLAHRGEVELGAIDALEAVEPAALGQGDATGGLRMGGAAHRVEGKGMEAQALVVVQAGGGMAPEQIRDAAAAQQGGVLEHLDVLPHGGQGLSCGCGGEGGRRWRTVAGEIDPAGPRIGQVALSARQLLRREGLCGVGALPGDGRWGLRRHSA